MTRSIAPARCSVAKVLVAPRDQDSVFKSELTNISASAYIEEINFILARFGVVFS